MDVGHRNSFVSVDCADEIARLIIAEKNATLKSTEERPDNLAFKRFSGRD
jgi:hypothetical protein